MRWHRPSHLSPPTHLIVFARNLPRHLRPSRRSAPRFRRSRQFSTVLPNPTRSFPAPLYWTGHQNHLTLAHSPVRSITSSAQQALTDSPCPAPPLPVFLHSQSDRFAKGPFAIIPQTITFSLLPSSSRISSSDRKLDHLEFPIITSAALPRDRLNRGSGFSLGHLILSNSISTTSPGPCERRQPCPTTKTIGGGTRRRRGPAEMNMMMAMMHEIQSQPQWSDDPEMTVPLLSRK